MGDMVLLFSICILAAAKDKEAETVRENSESGKQRAAAMVNGQLYYNTKKTDNESLRCGMMDGEIDSMVGGQKYRKRIINPIHYRYQLSDRDQEIELAMDGSWVIFKPWKPVVPLDIEE